MNKSKKETAIVDESERFKRGFNIIEEPDDYSYLANKKYEVSKFWTPKLLKWALYLNIFATLIVSMTFFFLLIRPTPEFYATTERGVIYHLNKFKNNK